ncbi:MAG: class II aldolase/adducin family protein, partial [Brevundimonas sp.]|nr:class II aldolase/adducin family protein [Brevundimonas sp.]
GIEQAIGVDQEGPVLPRHLQRILMLKNHGPVILGRSIGEIFIQHWSLQRACEIQLATMAAGQPVMIPDEVVQVHQRDVGQVRLPGGPGKADFDAWVRKIDKIDRSWRD